jgi:hypothetical protein
MADSTPMKTWTRWLAGGLLVACASLAAVAALALDRAPAVPERNDIRVADVAHALALARQHDPRQSRPGQLTQISLTERDIDLLLNHAAHRLLGVRVAIQMQPGQARLQASLPWGWGPLKGWLNLQARLQQTQGLPALLSWQLGGLPLPRALAQPALQAAATHLGAQPQLALVPEVVQQVQFEATQMSLSYVWQPDTSDRVLAALTPPAEQERLRAYAERLAELTRLGADSPRPLPALLTPMFELARQRSLTNDPAQENRAAVLTLALYVNGRSLASVVPAARHWPQPRPLQVQLAGRDDFPQHYLISAFLAMEGTSPLTQAIGLAKEVADAKGGSGFSFTDMAANRAGMRFGQLALNQPAILQQRLAQGVSEAGLLPSVQDLPEFLKQVEFEAFYGHVGSPPYQRVLADIEQRLNALPLYR